MPSTQVLSWSEVCEKLDKIDPRWKTAISYLTPEESLNGFNINRLWGILDQAWNEMVSKSELNAYTNEFLYQYYQHPVWLINAAFSESDVSTIEDRLAAVRLINHVSPKKILDFGGGIGTVSRLCSIKISEADTIDLVDISKFRNTVEKYLADHTNIRILEKPDPPYDAIICTEVLEHIADPINTIIKINSLLRIGGAFAASWSFAPCIKCHIPHNFHLNRLMLWIIRSLGFGFYGFERRGSTVYGFVKKSDIALNMTRRARVLSLLSHILLPIDRIMLALRGL